MAHLNYPLRFEPILKQYIWGGRRLGSMLCKPIGSENDYAESWEVVDHRDGQSVVSSGPHAGMSLGDLVSQLPEELFGTKQHDRFPLLFKFLDANKTLSVQVHPDDAYAQMMDPPDLGKTEAWVVVHADSGSLLYAGLKHGTTQKDLENAIDTGTVADVLNEIEVSDGDCIFIPAGTVHALGEGLVIAEIQQASNTTFRLFDWNRLGADGKPRDLHFKQSLEVTDFEKGPVRLQKSERIDDIREMLVECEQFQLQRWTVTAGSECDFHGHGGFQIVSVLEGAVELARDPSTSLLNMGETCLYPAACTNRRATAVSDSVLLVIQDGG